MPSSADRRPPPRRATACGWRLPAALAAAWAGFAASPAAAAADTPAIAPRALAATCAACHGTDGRPADATIPALAGRPAPELAAALHAFARGDRPSTVMQQIAKGYTEAQLDTLAAYFAARPR